MSDHTFPLADIRVLDLSRVLAGPFAGRMLSDLGAEVVKVEPPDRDVTRLWGKEIAGISGYFTQQNAGKSNISLDLQKTPAVDLLKRLAGNADLLVENFRPGVMLRLGIDYESLQAVNPRLIMLSITGFGQEGPEAERAAYAPIIHAETGSVRRMAEKNDGRHTDMCMSYADTNAGLHGLVALLSALYMRERTGLGQHIDIAMVDAMLCCDDQSNYALDDAPADTGASEVWEATGGPVMLAGDFRHIWRQIVAVHGVLDPTPPGARLEEKIRLRRRRAGEFFLSFASRGEFLAALDEANIAWGEVGLTRDFMLRSPTLKHRDSIAQIDDRGGGTRPIIQTPYRFSGARAGVRGGARYQGEDNERILTSWLGLEPTEIEALHQQRVLVRGEGSGA